MRTALKSHKVSSSSHILLVSHASVIACWLCASIRLCTLKAEALLQGECSLAHCVHTCCAAVGGNQ